MSVSTATIRAFSIFDGLTDGQLAELLAGSAEIPIAPGAELFREGEHADFWWVLVDGAIDLVRLTGREHTVVGKMDVPGRWAGGFRAWDEHGVYLATGRRAGAAGAGRGAARPGQRLVPARRAPHPGAVPHRAEHRVDGQAA
jgi:CRP-like cAMP-binding protein